MPFSICSLILHSALSWHIISAAGRCLIRCSGDQCWWLCVTEAGTEIEWYPTLNNCTISHWIDEIQILQAALILTVPTDLVFNIVTVITFVKIFDGFLITFSRKNWKNHTRVEFFRTPGIPAVPKDKALTLPYRPVLSASLRWRRWGLPFTCSSSRTTGNALLLGFTDNCWWKLG